MINLMKLEAIGSLEFDGVITNVDTATVTANLELELRCFVVSLVAIYLPFSSQGHGPFRLVRQDSAPLFVRSLHGPLKSSFALLDS